MVVNLFATVPKDHPGANPPEYFSGVVVNVAWALLHGPFWLVLHASLGLLLVAGAVVILVQAIRSRTRRQIVTASFGLFGVLGAGFNGGSYLNYHEDFSSMLMAGGFAIAVVSYAGGMTFGLYADRATVPDLDVLRDGIVTSLLELAALAHATSTAR